MEKMAIQKHDWNPRSTLARAFIEFVPQVPVTACDLEPTTCVVGPGKTCKQFETPQIKTASNFQASHASPLVRLQPYRRIIVQFLAHYVATPRSFKGAEYILHCFRQIQTAVSLILMRNSGARKFRFVFS
jgi:hypothetical protein